MSAENSIGNLLLGFSILTELCSNAVILGIKTMCQLGLEAMSVILAVRMLMQED